MALTRRWVIRRCRLRESQTGGAITVIRMLTDQGRLAQAVPSRVA